MADVRTWDDMTLADLKKAMRSGIVLIFAAVAVGGYVWWTLWGTGLT